jgi:hypothetical protein
MNTIPAQPLRGDVVCWFANYRGYGVRDSKLASLINSGMSNSLHANLNPV